MIHTVSYMVFKAMKRANYKRNDIKKLWKGPFTKEIVLKAMKMANYNRNARGRRGGDRMVVGFTITCAISAYYHESCDFEPRSWRGVLDRTLCDKVCQWLATGRYNCNIVESDVKYHEPKPNQKKW